MSPSDLHGRRANADDLPALEAMWRTVGLSPEDLDPRFTEFQVVEDPIGNLVAALGIRIAGPDALIHSETIPDFALADIVRPILWERLKNLAKNLGAVRIWTRENAPFWRQLEFTAPDGEHLAKLPSAFRSGEGTLLLLVLREDEAIKRVEQEFEMFRLEEKARVDELKSQGKVWQWIATIIAIALFIFVVVGAVRLFRATQRRSAAPIHSAPPARVERVAA